METVDVVIVGGGPAGLALALSLAMRKVNSIVLEQQSVICEDPRAIALAGDSHRILCALGTTPEAFSQFSQSIDTVNFHYGTYAQKPYFTIDNTQDWLDQGMANALVILQPKLELMMRDMLDASEYSQLKTSCRVIDRVERGSIVETTYVDMEGIESVVRSQFLIGADGKRGTVRKCFLEPLGIKQEVGVHEYSQSWVAANVKVRMPTPQSHPLFPLWKLGYDPEQLWDLFWPQGFHFCNHPTMPVATGRFGPMNERFWRFEYELPSGVSPGDPLDDLKKQMLPYLTIPASHFQALDCDSVSFPWDCVDVIRCAPALFEHKVVNRWYDGRTILIGDAAHVFPPFGAQGIASGIRDAFALSWRLAFLCTAPDPSFKLSEPTDAVLGAWARERRMGIDNSSHATMDNGKLLHNKSWLLATALGTFSSCMEFLPFLRTAFFRSTMRDSNGYRGLVDGCFLPDAMGGAKLAQVWIRSRSCGSPFLSDQIWAGGAPLTLLALTSDRSECEEAQAALRQSTTVTHRIFNDTIVMVSAHKPTIESDDKGMCEDSGVEEYTVCGALELENSHVPIMKGYDEKSFGRRFASGVKFALVRADFIIFSQARSAWQLQGHISRARDMLGV